MKLRNLFIIGLLVFLLSGCESPFDKYEPLVINRPNSEEAIKKLSDKELFAKYKKTVPKGEYISKMVYLEMDRNYKGKELFVLSHNKKNTFFRVFSFDKDKEKFTKIFEEKAPYNAEEPFFVQGIAPFFANETNHIVIGQHKNPNMFFFYLFIGQTPKHKNIEILVDNALKKNAKGIFNGNAVVGEQTITILRDSSIYKVYYQTDTGYNIRWQHFVFWHLSIKAPKGAFFNESI